MRSKKAKIISIITIIAILIALLCGWVAWGNTALETNTYTIESESLPANFSGYRIAQVSDLHNAEMGDNNEKLLEMLKSARPDMIAITGDLIDSRNTDTEVALDFVKEALKIAPCYFVTGNHEARIENYDEFEKKLTDAGVVVLDDDEAIIEKNGQKIRLIGVDDVQFITEAKSIQNSVMNSKLKKLAKYADGFTILLSHRPGFFELYEEHNIELVLSGHSHGGQFRIPFAGGVYTPDDGFFPEYDAGLFEEDNTSMIVSRGIGNSAFPFRVNNRPEVLLIILKQEKGNANIEKPDDFSDEKKPAIPE